MNRHLAFAFIAAASLAGVACAPGVVLDRPDDWPTRWAGRDLYHTPNAYIYASSPAAAGEADRIAARVAGEVAAPAGGEIRKGLIVISDVGDPLPVKDVEAWFAMLDRADREESPTSQADFNILAEDDEASATSQPSTKEDREKFRKLGLSLEDLALCAPVPLQRDDLPTMDLPSPVLRDVVWTVAMPTEGLCRRTMSQMMRAVMKSDEITLGQRLLIAPWIPFMESAMTDELAASRGPVLFEQMVLCRPEWSDAEKRERIEAYNKKAGREQEARLARRASTAAASTQPATSQMSSP